MEKLLVVLLQGSLVSIKIFCLTKLIKFAIINTKKLVSSPFVRLELHNSPLSPGGSFLQYPELFSGFLFSPFFYFFI